MRKTTEIHRMDWNGLLLEITYEPNWVPACIAGEEIAHLRVRSIYPTDVPMPITESGFNSRTLLASTVAAADGPVNFVDVMLAAESAGEGAA